MAEEPEQMLEQDRIAATLRIEEGGAENCVHPVPAPSVPGSPSKNNEAMNRANDAGNSQNEMLFMCGNAMPGEPIISGISQLPKPPINAGMITKKIMISPWAVTVTS
jgi:hypothetical protein